ncbi:hypothetical protein PVAND_014453 [Polypedilum vanderplanki]|uniref:Chitin-binding type-2 domain-containing protein n=1 Tax=Polypedilum vanderplanki TaxID=319348 RepID=A0A9J6BA13_POLVA|nr:hypothetical protein PVAND_014453 [Polypedilum vanderplanki]
MKTIFFSIFFLNISLLQIFAFNRDFEFVDSSGQCWSCTSRFDCQKCDNIRRWTERRQCLPPTPFECSFSNNIGFRYPSRDLPFYYMCTLSHGNIRRECPCGKVFDFNQQCCTEFENMKTPRDLCVYDESNIRKPNPCGANQIAIEILRNSQCLPPNADDCCGRLRHRFPSNDLANYYECDNSRDGFRIHQCPCDTLFNYELQRCIAPNDAGKSRCSNPINKYPIPCSPNQTTNRPGPSTPGQNRPPNQPSTPGQNRPTTTIKPNLPNPPIIPPMPDPYPPINTPGPKYPTTTTQQKIIPTITDDFPTLPTKPDPYPPKNTPGTSYPKTTTTQPKMIPTVTNDKGNNDFPTLPTNTPFPPIATTTTKFSTISIPIAPTITATTKTIHFTTTSPLTTKRIALPTETKNPGIYTTERNIGDNFCNCMAWWNCRCHRLCWSVPCSNFNIIG